MERLGLHSIKAKLLFTYLPVIFLSLICLSTFVYWVTAENMKKRAIENFQYNNSHTVTAVDSFFDTMIQISRLGYWDASAQAVLNRNSREYLDKNGYSDYYLHIDFNLITMDFLGKMLALNEYIDSLYFGGLNTGQVYTKNYPSIYSYQYETEEWYQQVINSDSTQIIGLHPKYNRNSEKNINVITIGTTYVQPITKEKLGVLLINISPSQFSSLLKSSHTGGGQEYLIDENNYVIYSPNAEEIGKNAYDVISFEWNSETEVCTTNVKGEETLLVSRQSPISHWHVVSSITTKELYQDISFFRNSVLILSGCVLSFFVFLSFMLANKLTRPIKDLNLTINEIKTGNLDIAYSPKGRDEISQIGYSLEDMAHKLKQMVQQIKETESQYRAAELQALQAQINPHFMYNTLNAIKWIADIQGSNGISDMIFHLISLLNFTAKVKTDFITVYEEISFLQDYISLINLRYFNHISVNWDIPEEIYSYQILKFLLQPFVENALFHGYDGVQADFSILLSAYKKETDLVFIISDNGKGMNQQTVDTLMQSGGTSKSFNSIGISNVIQRIHFHFGEKYGIKIYSQEGVGTKVEIQIPEILGSEKSI